MNRKRISALLAALLAVSCLMGCGQTGAPAPEESAPAAEMPADEPTAAEEPAPAPAEEPAPAPAEEAKEEKLMEITLEELLIPNGDRTVYGKLYRPVTDEKCPAIILSHGYNGSHADWTRECAYYARHGFVAYTLDFCGSSARSRSTGLDSTEMTISTEKADLLAVFEAIRALDCVDENNVVLFGGSQGGLVSALTAAELGSEVKALGLYFPALCVPDDWKQKYDSPADAPETFDFWGLMLGQGFVEDVFTLDVFGTIGNYKGPVLILHGDKDEIVPYSYSEKAVETYASATLIEMPGEGHGFTPEGAATAMEHVLSFITEVCKAGE